MNIQIRNHKGDGVIEIILPDDYHDRSMTLIGLATWEVMFSIDGRLKNYTRVNKRHLRESVNYAISTHAINNTVKDMVLKGFIKINEKEEIFWIDEDWKNHAF